MANQKLLKTLKLIIDIISSNKNLDFNNPDLFNFSEKGIFTVIGNPLIFIDKKNKLEDEVIDFNLLKFFLNHLNTNKSIVRLNHIGFGYLISSKNAERERLIKLVRKTKFYLYEEDSNDFGLWLFMGNTNNWQNPLVEFVPVEKSIKNYDEFLPHIQIDIDTKYSSEEIDRIIKKHFGNAIMSYHIAVINGITYIVRIKLGVIEGVNIFLDLATNFRNVKFHRKNILKQIS